MATKVFINGDFRQIIIDNDYPTPYKVFYNNKWNYIQPEDDFVSRLNSDEVYLYRFTLKVFNGNWVKLALLDNYYNKNEVRKSLFYKTITKENFSYKPRAVNFTELDARLGLNNLKDLFLSNEDKKLNEQVVEDTNLLKNDEVLYKLGTRNIYNEIDTINYKLSEKDNFESNVNTNFLEDKAELDYYYSVEDFETLELNNSNIFEISEQLEIIDNCITLKQDLSNAKKVNEILINNWNSVAGNPAPGPGQNCGGLYRFYNENSELIRSGDVITNNATSGETENFIVECYSTYANALHLSPINAIRTDLSDNCIPTTSNLYASAGGTTPYNYLKITFKNPQYITKILANPLCYYNGSFVSSNYCEVNLIYEDDTQLNIPVTVTAFNQVITEDYLAQIYNTSDIQYFNTTVNKFENFNINSFSKFYLTGKNLDIDSIDFKIALSFNENNYFTFKDGNWNFINKDSTEIFNNGMTLKEFTSITKNDIKSYFGEVQKCDLYFSFLNKKTLYDIPKFEKIYKFFEIKSKQNYLTVDQILINNFVTDHQNVGGIYRFYDENGNLIESGNILNYTGTYAESENFIMESYDYHTLSGNMEMFGIMNGFRTDIEKSAIPITENVYVTTTTTNNHFMSLKFKIPKMISKIECNPKAYFPPNCGTNTVSCTINLMSNGKIIKSFDINNCQANIIQTLENFNNISYYDDLIGIVKTNTNQLQNIDKIEKIQIVANELENTKIKIALSTDSKSTYLKFNNTDFKIIQENDIINNGNTIDEINNLTYQELNLLDLTNKTLDFIICMETSDTTITPNIEKIIVTSINVE